MEDESGEDDTDNVEEKTNTKDSKGICNDE